MPRGVLVLYYDLRRLFKSLWFLFVLSHIDVASSKGLPTRRNLISGTSEWNQKLSRIGQIKGSITFLRKYWQNIIDEYLRVLSISEMSCITLYLANSLPFSVLIPGSRDLGSVMYGCLQPHLCGLENCILLSCEAQS